MKIKSQEETYPDTILLPLTDFVEQGKKYGLSLTWRTLNYYRKLGLLPPPERIPYDKCKYYPKTILKDLAVYYFLQNYLGFTLEEIKILGDKFKLPKFQQMYGQQHFNLFTAWVKQTYNAFYKVYSQGGRDRSSFDLEQAAILSLMNLNASYKKKFEESGVEYLKKNLSRAKDGKITMPVLVEQWVQAITKE
ncbi:MAG: MerR family transcriptional regulator [Candidatus Omnitrophota bacterium]